MNNRSSRSHVVVSLSLTHTVVCCGQPLPHPYCGMLWSASPSPTLWYVVVSLSLTHTIVVNLIKKRVNRQINLPYNNCKQPYLQIQMTSISCSLYLDLSVPDAHSCSVKGWSLYADQEVVSLYCERPGSMQ